MKYILEYEHKDKDFEDVWHIEKEYLDEKTIAGIEQTIKWEEQNHDIHIFVRKIDIDKIVGEITLIPLSEKQFNDFMNNKLEDTDINENTLIKYHDNNKYYLLFSAIAIDKNYRSDRTILSLLLKGLYEKIKQLQNRNILILNMCAEGQTSDGQKFIESFLNLKFKRYTNKGYKLYKFDCVDEFDDWFKKLPDYISNYNKKFNL